MSIMSAAELLLWGAFAFVFWRKRMQCKYPAMGIYLGLHLAAAPVSLALIYGLPMLSWRMNHIVYFFFYWTVYAVSAVLLYFICGEVFRSALAGLHGLKNLGVVAFRWVAVISVLLSIPSNVLIKPSLAMFPAFALSLMRSVSILELGLLAFLCLSMNALRLSVRDAAFGISLGFGMMAANDFIQTLMISVRTPLTAPWQFVYQGVLLSILGGWATFFALPEPVRKPAVLPVTSTIFRWNEIATALGHGETQVAVQPASGFFLTDVEQVVERVLARNAKSRESES